jgi:DNA-directed RNA polymerase subunit M/transcription elongation factor TFIIS
MILIESVFHDDSTPCTVVRCPLCKRGRLCDKPSEEKATVIALTPKQQLRTTNKVILKCPKCSNKFAIYFSKEK